MTDRRLLVIGLDCAAPELVFERFRPRLPTLSKLMAHGSYGRLRSVTPPITVPAWMCMMTGKDPGRLGIYGFRNRASYAYDALRLASSLDLGAAPFWEELNIPSIVVGVPPSYPPHPMNGLLVTCHQTPDDAAQWTHPPELAERIRKWVGPYLFDVPDFRTDNREKILEDIYTMTDKRFRVMKALLREHPWRFAAMVEIGLDRIHHAFWKYMDPTHPKHEPGHRFATVVEDYYAFLDRRIAELLDDTTVLVVSDHGAKALHGAFCINEWLVREGLLSLRETPKQATRFSPELVDWPRTLAWAEGGYYARIMINVQGREPQGRVAAVDYDRVRQRIIDSLPDARVFRPEELYRERRGIPPDLLAFFGDLHWRAAGSVGTGTLTLQENDTGPDDANHDWDGIFICSEKVSVPAGLVECRSLMERLLEV